MINYPLDHSEATQKLFLESRIKFGQLYTDHHGHDNPRRNFPTPRCTTVTSSSPRTRYCLTRAAPSQTDVGTPSLHRNVPKEHANATVNQKQMVLYDNSETPDKRTD